MFLKEELFISDKKKKNFRKFKEFGNNFQGKEFLLRERKNIIMTDLLIKLEIRDIND